MQNLLVFCRYCFTWVEPHSQMCPECSAEIVLDDHDLDRDVLSEILGKPLSVLGCVRIDRPGLPNLGELIGTTEGVLFLPRLHRRLNGAWEGVESSRLPGWWPFRGDQTSPRFLEWLKHPLGIKVEPISAVDPVPQPDRVSLAERLMESPGGFFAELRWIESITSRRRTVKLNRTHLRTITVIDETEDGSLHAALDSLVRQAARAVS